MNKFVALLFLASLTLSNFIRDGNPEVTKPSPFPPTKIFNLIDEYMSRGSNAEYLGSGSLNGCFTDNEFWEIYLRLRSKNPDLIGQLQRIGQSFEKRHIHGFFFGTNHSNIIVNPGEVKNRNIVFFNALIHARECITLSMILQIMVNKLMLLKKKDSTTLKFFANNIIL